jgi:hypothetical protein
MKKCSKCKEAVPKSQFGKDKQKLDGLTSSCKECSQKYYQSTKEHQKEYAKKYYRSNSDERIEYQKKYRKVNRETILQKGREYKRDPEQARATKYGISTLDLELMYKRQNSQCALCGITENETGKKLVIDHCHAEGHVRALLCNPCNLGLGHFKDNPETLEKALKYVRHHIEN